MQLKELFRNHIGERQEVAAKALAETQFEGLILDAGFATTYFADDRDAPFVPTPHFAHWCPAEGQGHLLHIVPGRKPRLYFYGPADYWTERAVCGDAFWTSEFEILTVENLDGVWVNFSNEAKTAYIGSNGKRALEAGLVANPNNLTKRLDWARAYKSDYEIECLKEANRRAGLGHQAARAGFFEGMSEFEIHLAYMRASGSTESELPYNNIIALNEKGAFLHYEPKRQTPRQGRSLLIDAGARFFGYCSDVTRTHVVKGQIPEAEIFTALRDGVEQLQKKICAMVKPGLQFVDLHREAERQIGEVLIAGSILQKISIDQACEQGLVRVFFPHGLGHLLGIQVHDIGGHQLSPAGQEADRDPRYPHLRTLRNIEKRMVFTVEPGLYFIKPLLEQAKTGPTAQHFNYSLIDRLAEFGGIRIEDEVVVTADGHVNLTRPFTP